MLKQLEMSGPGNITAWIPSSFFYVYLILGKPRSSPKRSFFNCASRRRGDGSQRTTPSYGTTSPHGSRAVAANAERPFRKITQTTYETWSCGKGQCTVGQLFISLISFYLPLVTAVPALLLYMNLWIYMYGFMYKIMTISKSIKIICLFFFFNSLFCLRQELSKVDNYGQDFPNEVCFSLRPDKN